MDNTNIRSIIVCGGRYYTNKEFLWKQLDYWFPYLDGNILIHGGAKGADTIAGNWTLTQKGIGSIVYPANWDKHGKSAGWVRNWDMANTKPTPIAVLAFPGGKGTASMVKIARDKNIFVVELGG